MTTSQFLKSCQNAAKKIEKKNAKKFWKPAEFKEGETRFRVVGLPIHGWLDWLDNAPFRYRDDEEPQKSFDPAKPMRYFWALHVWDYERKDLYILEILQSSIINRLKEIMSDEDWEDITAYDLKIKKEGKLKLTKYQVSPALHKPMVDEIKEALKHAPVRLEALYDGGNPWTDLEAKTRDPEPSNEPRDPIKDLALMLNEHIQLAEPHMVRHYLEFAQPRISKPLDEAVDIWISKPDELIKAYNKWLSSDTARQIRESLQT